MGFFNRFFKTGDTVKTGTQSSSPSIPMTVTSFDTAMTQSAFWASVRLLSETVAAMPLICYKKDQATGIKVKDTNNDLWRLLNYQPNRYQTRTEFFESIMLNLVTRGNAYIKIQRAAKRITSLSVLPAAQTEPVLLSDGSIVYKHIDANNNVAVYAEETIWHIRIFGNGIIGFSPLEYAASTLGLSKNLADRQSKLAANGGKTNGILSIDQALKPDQKESIRKSFKGLQEGNQDELFILEAGFKYQQASLSPSDQQLLESRRFTIEDIARFMGVPSVLINDTASSTTWGSGIEQINMGFYKLNLKPYLERIESSLKRWLMDKSDWDTIDIEFEFDSLLRADVATRAETQSKQINSGQKTPNEVRADEGLPPLDGGDKIYLNSSLVPAGTQSKQIQVMQNGI